MMRSLDLTKLYAALLVISALGLLAYVANFGTPLSMTAITAAKKVKREPQVRLLSIPGNREVLAVVLVPKAVERLGIATAKVREERRSRIRRLSATVIEEGGTLAVHVPVSGRTDLPTLGQPARVFALDDKSRQPVLVEPGKPGAVVERKGLPFAVFAAPALGQRFKPGEPVTVEMAVGEPDPPRRIIPFASVLYDPKGKAWTYTNPQPLRYVRVPIEIAYIENGEAYLTDGPPAGTVVVTDGSVELYGAESKLGI